MSAEPSVEPNSDTWLAVKKWAEKALAEQLKLLKDPTVPHDATQVARGEVRRLEELLALPHPRAKPKIEAGVDYHA